MEEEAGLLGSTPSVQERPRGIGGLSLRNVWDSLMVMSEGPEALPLQCVGATVQVARGGAAHQDAASWLQQIFKGEELLLGALF